MGDNPEIVRVAKALVESLKYAIPKIHPDNQDRETMRALVRISWAEQTIKKLEG